MYLAILFHGANDAPSSISLGILEDDKAAGSRFYPELRLLSVDTSEGVWEWKGRRYKMGTACSLYRTGVIGVFDLDNPAQLQAMTAARAHQYPRRTSYGQFLEVLRKLRLARTHFGT